MGAKSPHFFWVEEHLALGGIGCLAPGSNSLHVVQEAPTSLDALGAFPALAQANKHRIGQPDKLGHFLGVQKGSENGICFHGIS